MSERTFALVGNKQQWERATHDGTQVDARGLVALDWYAIEQRDGEISDIETDSGALAFDEECRLYRSVPEEGRVERSRPSAHDAASGTTPDAYDLFPAPVTPAGDFSASDAAIGALNKPAALAVDCSDRLYIAERGTRRVLVYDIWSYALLARVPVYPQQPLDLARSGAGVFVLLDEPALLLELVGRDARRRFMLPDDISHADRFAVSPDGTFVVLTEAASATAELCVLALQHEDAPDPMVLQLRVAQRLFVAHATDIEFDANGVLVVARRAGESFLRFDAVDRDPMPPMRARGFEGGGLVRAPEGRIAFWTQAGLRFPYEARVRYASTGRVTTFRLDGGEYQRIWGRVFVDACVPQGTSLRVACATTDDDDETVDLSAAETLPMYPRGRGPELPWIAARDRERTLEAPVAASAGRYLWVALELRGNGRASPIVRCLRAEQPAHEHLRRLPRTFSRDEDIASFLRRYLAMFDGMLDDMRGRAEIRHVLIDPRSAPSDQLSWLASFVGLVLDDRWEEHAKRTAIAEAAWLFRYRGTVPGMKRFLEIVSDAEVIIIERFKLRGQGGALLGDTGSAFTSSIVGGGFRVGGALSTPEETPLSGTTADAFVTHAHRFTVILTCELSAEKMAVVQRVLDVHRPAHTLYDLCTVGAGMRVGRSLHVALSSIVGRSAGWKMLKLGGGTLGRNVLLGRAPEGVQHTPLCLGNRSELR